MLEQSKIRKKKKQEGITRDGTVKEKRKESALGRKEEEKENKRGTSYQAGFRCNEFHPQWVIMGLARLPVSPSRARWKEEEISW